jgi:hypothetical protein
MEITLKYWSMYLSVDNIFHENEIAPNAGLKIYILFRNIRVSSSTN